MFELKCKALLAHPSQMGVEVIEFATWLGHWMAEGQNFEYGEAFRRIVFRND